MSVLIDSRKIKQIIPQIRAIWEQHQMPVAPTDIRSLARSHTATALRTLALIASQGENEGARVSAAVALLDRGWGKPATTHTGADGDGDIRVVIRHIVEGRDVEPRVVDLKPAPILTNGEGK